MTAPHDRPRLAADLAPLLAASALLFASAFPLAHLGSAAAADAPTGAAPVVEIRAHRFEFTPAAITLERGRPGTLRLTSADVTHGFFQRDLGIDATIERGHPTDVQIHPTAPGRHQDHGQDRVDGPETPVAEA